MKPNSTSIRPLSCGLCLLLALFLNIPPAPAQDSPGRIQDLSLLPTGKVRIPVETSLADPDTLLLESSSSLLGPWAKEPDFQRSIIPGGREFLVPLHPGFPQRFYRARQLAPDTKPFIRYLSPKKYVIPGRVVNFLGARFSPVAGENTVRFERGTDSWTVAATASTAEFLSVVVPAALPATPLPTDTDGVPYRVTVTNAAGTSNGVGCYVASTGSHALTIRPTLESVQLIPPPGSPVGQLLVGGGTPPYTLVPLTPSEATQFSAQLSGAVITVSALPGVTLAAVDVMVRDSAPFRGEVTQTVIVQNPYFRPPFSAAFRTLLAGTAPALSLTSSLSGLRTEQLEVKFQNLQPDLTALSAGSLLGMARLYRSRATFDILQMVVTEAGAERVKFDVVSNAGTEPARFAAGELIAHPPTLLVSLFNQGAATDMPTTVDLEILLNDGIFRLPAASGQTVTLTATFTSVSVHPARYVPTRYTAAPLDFTTTGLSAGAPGVERLMPIHGEIRRSVQLRGTGFAADPAQNTVTFAGPGGTRVPAPITGHSAGELVVMVPPGAISGPVRVETGGKTSNDTHFAVRFSPSMMLLFGSFTGGTPVAPRFFHQQPLDEGETRDELPPKKFTATLDRGRLSTAGLTVGQIAGTSHYRNDDGGASSINILYRGTETGPPLRHRFVVRTGSMDMATFYAHDDPDGDGVIMELVNSPTGLRLSPGDSWDHRFTAAFYRPPPAGQTVVARLDAESEPWMPFAGSGMHVIQNFSRKTLP